MNNSDSKLLILVSVVFIQLGLWLPFYLPSDWGLLPLGMSFLADGVVLLLIGLIAWGYEILQRARKEDELNNWLEARDMHWKEDSENNGSRQISQLE